MDYRLFACPQILLAMSQESQRVLLTVPAPPPAAANERRFATELMKSVDDVEISDLFRFLREMVINRGDRPGKLPYSRYFLAMDIVRMYGSIPGLTRDQITELISFVENLLLQSVKQMASLDTGLPVYPGLEGTDSEGVNILHVIAMYTQSNPELAEGFLNAARNAGLLTKINTKAGGKVNGIIPLHVAAECNNRPVVEILIRKDESQLGIHNAQGLSASDIALGVGNTSMAAFIMDKEKEYRRKKSLREASRVVSKEGLNLLGVVEPFAPTAVIAVADPGTSETPAVTASEQTGIAKMLELLRGGTRAANGTETSTPESSSRDPRISSEESSDQTVDESGEDAAGDTCTREESTPSIADREEQVKELGKFIQEGFETVPNGDMLWTVYWEFVVRSGITQVDQLKAALKRDDKFCDKFPNFFVSYVKTI